MIVDLKDFVLTGDFAGLGPTITRAQLEGLFGPPETTGGEQSRCNKRPLIWKYGDIEFHFASYWQDADVWREGTLRVIFADAFEAAPKGWGKLEVSSWVLRRGLPLESFIVELKPLGVRFTLERRPDWNQTKVVLSSGVSLVFVNQQDEFGSPPGLTLIIREFQPEVRN